MRVDILNVVGSLFKSLHVVLLELTRLADDGNDAAALHLRHLKTGDIGQDIGEIAEQHLKLG